MPNNSQKEIQKRVKKINEIYNNYLKELAKLQKRQNEIIEKFRQELEKRKMEELKKALE